MNRSFKIYYFTLVILLLYSCNQNRNSNIDINGTKYSPWHYSIDWNFENNSPYLTDCKNDLNKFQVTFNKKIFYNDHYNYKFKLKVDDHEILDYTIDSTGDNYNYSFGKSLQEIIEKDSAKTKIKVKAEIFQIVTNGENDDNIYIEKEEQNINIIKSGTIYSIIRQEGIGFPPNYQPCQQSIDAGFYKDYLICNDKKNTLLVYQKKPFDLDKLDSNFNIFKFNLSDFFEITFDSLNNKKREGNPSIIKLEGGGTNSNKCQYLSFLINFNKSVKYNYLSDCIFELDDSLISKKVIYTPLNLNFIPCNVELPE